jgi:hypothetical protein
MNLRLILVGGDRLIYDKSIELVSTKKEPKTGGSLFGGSLFLIYYMDKLKIFC